MWKAGYGRHFLAMRIPEPEERFEVEVAVYLDPYDAARGFVFEQPVDGNARRLSDRGLELNMAYCLLRFEYQVVARVIHFRFRDFNPAAPIPPPVSGQQFAEEAMLD